MKKDKLTKLPQTAMFVAVILLMFAAFVISICIGQFSISLDEIRRILTGGEVSDITRKVFMNLRFPRTCMAMLAGIGLGTSGCIYQTIFKNPLASPDIVGVAPGANLGAAIAIVMLGGSTLSIATGAFCGGIIMSHISKAFIMILKFFSDPENELAAIEFWTMGSLANVTAKKTLAIFPIFLISLIGLILLRRQIDMLSLNEDECRMLGVNVSTVRTIILIFSTLMTASIISVTGLISFVGYTCKKYLFGRDSNQYFNNLDRCTDFSLFYVETKGNTIMSILFDVKDIHVSYGANEIVKGVSFSLKEGELCALLGLNGSGKTTMMRGICGLIPAKGNAYVNGIALESMNERMRAKYLSFIPQVSSPIQGKSVMDILLMGANPHLRLLETPGKKFYEAAYDALKKLDLEDFADRDFGKLSQGQKQLIILARTLVQNSPVMLMDEPDSALDFLNRHMVLSKIRILQWRIATVCFF